ncbi:MAG: DsbA family protein [Asticcacaulis sp.]
MTDPAALTALSDANDKALKSGITGTPAFFINGKKFDYHGGGIAEFDAALKPALEAPAK